jgi:intracellular septation protein A
MRPLSLLLGFLPWIAFSFVAQRMAADAVAWSALLAVAMTAVALALAARTHGPTMLDRVSLVLFATIAVAGFAGGAALDDWLYTWGRPLVGVVLGLVVLGTASSRPFTEEYARQSTPREHWDSPTFHAINRVISAAWGAGLVVVGSAALLVTFLDEHATGRGSAHLTELVLDWVVPIAVVWGLVSFSGSYPDRVTGPPSGPEGARPTTRPAAERPRRWRAATRGGSTRTPAGSGG